jgi:hypothetical protein
VSHGTAGLNASISVEYNTTLVTSELRISTTRPVYSENAFSVMVSLSDNGSGNPLRTLASGVPVVASRRLLAFQAQLPPCALTPCTRCRNGFPNECEVCPAEAPVLADGKV